MRISGRTLLFVEKDKSLLRDLSDYFAVENAALFVTELSEARKYLRFFNFDAMVLDLDDADGEGLELLKSEENLPPTVVLSSRTAESDILNALYLGACDYITKPCSMKLLEAKLKLRLRPSTNAMMSCDGLVTNPISKVAKYYDTIIPLTASEFNILAFLMKNHGQFFTSDELYEKIWRAQSYGNATIRKHISSLRQKLQNACMGREFITNEFGKGYTFPGTVVFE